MDRKKTILRLTGAIPRQEHARLAEPIDFSLPEGEILAILGDNGAGKSTFTDVLSGRHPLMSGSAVCYDPSGNEMPLYKGVKVVSFRDIYTIVDRANSYYQQRWNMGVEHEAVIARSMLVCKNPEWLAILIEWFGIGELLDREVTMFSSGELRKFLLVRALMEQPRVIVFDNPFIGLDVAARELFCDVLRRLSEMQTMGLILVLTDPKDIPDFATRILSVDKMSINPQPKPQTAHRKLNVALMRRLQKTVRCEEQEFETAIEMSDVTVRYGEKIVVERVNWRVRRGEKWVLRGRNGSGKSTLLSLINGDNPQAYANNIVLFDRKRGSGESIWDIKRRIGYLSPEMHLYYTKDISGVKVVGSGFFDTVGLYQECDGEMLEVARGWMTLFEIEHLAERSFMSLSSGEQRLLLLARAFVKNPPLLILDEPFHGIDPTNRARARKIIEAFCDHSKTLIFVTHYDDEIPSMIEHRLNL